MDFMQRRQLGRSRPYRIHTWEQDETGKLVPVTTKDNRSIWDLLKEFINSMSDNDIFTRRDMLHYIYGIDSTHRGTVDTYRNLLTKIGILEMTLKPGRYKRIRNIPNELTTKLLQEMTNQNSWKSWFISLDHLPTKQTRKGKS